MLNTEEECDENKFKKNAKKIIIKKFSRGKSHKIQKKIMIKNDIKKRIYFL